MITFEEAYKKAKKLKNNIDGYFEYENGYVFSGSEDIHYKGGAGHTAVVIEKKTGKAINMPQFVVNGTGKEIQGYDLIDGVFVESEDEEEDEE
ncbi:MAG: hypothetical protein ACOX75_04270 [Lachnospiraceae bacterium]